MKVVINNCFGGFGLSHKAILRYAELKGFSLYYEEPENDYGFVSYYKVPQEQYDKYQKLWYAEDGDHRRINDKDWYFSPNDIERTDPILIQIIEEMGESANSRCGELNIIEIPDGVEYKIDEYDGLESIHEVHRSWN